MPGLFTKVKSTAKEQAPVRRSESLWLIDDEGVANALHAFVTTHRQAKTLAATADVQKQIVKQFADQRYVADFVAIGAPPESPYVVQNPAGDRVTFVLEDRSGQSEIKAGQREELVELLGEEKVKELLFEEATFGFNRDILAIPGVLPVLEKALEGAIKKLTAGESPTLSQEQAGLLLTVKVRTALKPGTLKRLGTVCNRSVTKLGRFLEIVGSAFTRYIKAG